MLLLRICVCFDRVKPVWTETGRNGNLLLVENSNCTKDMDSRGSNCSKRSLHAQEEKKNSSP